MSKLMSIFRIALFLSRHAKSAGAAIWKYYKVEAAPPMTLSMLHGPVGKNIENTAANVADGVIKGLSQKISAMEHEAIQAIKAKEAAIKAQMAKQAEEAKKAEEQKKKVAAEAAKKASAEKAAADAKKEAEAKAAQAKKDEAKKAKDSKKDKKPKK